MNRRQVLQSFGTGTALATVGSFSGGATEEQSRNTFAEQINYTEEELSTAETYRRINQAYATEPVRSMRQALVSRSAAIDTTGLNGMRVNADNVPEHTVIEAPLRSRDGSEWSEGNQLISVRIYPNETISVEAALENQILIADTNTAQSSQETVLTGEEYLIERPSGESAQESGNVSIESTHSWPDWCTLSGTFNPNGAACDLIKGVGGLLGAAMVVFPEPGTSAGGAAIVLGLGPSCDIMSGLAKATNGDCNVTEYEICLQAGLILQLYVNIKECE